MAGISGVFKMGSLAASVLALASCKTAPPSVTTAATQPSATTRVALKLYSGSSTGLVVGQDAAGGNPGAQLPGQSFAENPGLAKTFIWSFASGSTMLDGACAAITRTQAINVANSPGANTAVFIGQAAAGGAPAAIRVQILPAHSLSASDC